MVCPGVPLHVLCAEPVCPWRLHMVLAALGEELSVVTTLLPLSLGELVANDCLVSTLRCHLPPSPSSLAFPAERSMRPGTTAQKLVRGIDLAERGGRDIFISNSVPLTRFMFGAKHMLAQGREAASDAHLRGWRRELCAQCVKSHTS